MKLAMKEIVADSLNNSRSVLEGIEELAQSIKEVGMLQPVVVEEREDGRYYLFAGFRRYAAMKSLGETDIEAVIVQEGEGVKANVVENVCRDDISTYDFARGLLKLSETGLSADKIRKIISNGRKDGKGSSKSNINNLIRLVKNLDPAILLEWQSNHPLATTENLLKVVAKEDQIAAWNAMLSTGFPENAEEAEEGESGESEPKERLKRRTPAQMGLLLARLEATKGIKAAQIDSVREAFEWALGRQATVHGVALSDD